MSKKIELNIVGKSRPSLKGLFKKYISRKMHELKKRTEYYYKSFPFLEQWGIDEEDAELLLRYYGCIDKYGNIIYDSPKDKDSIWDEEDYWDEYEEIYPGSSSSSSYDDEYSMYSDKDESRKRGKNGKYKHTKSKKSKKTYDEAIEDITRPYSQGFIDEDDELFEKKIIYFYPEHSNKTDRLEFNDLKEFDEFCEKSDFSVPPYVGERIAYRSVSHCCLNPNMKKRGVYEIMGAETYSEMFFEAVEELEESWC
jgi:hypothetical protein